MKTKFKYHVIVIAFYLATVAISSGCSSTKKVALPAEDKQEWELANNENSSYQLYTRKSDISKVNEFKIVGTINSTSQNSLFWVIDKIVNNQKYEKGAPAIEVLENTPTGLLTYSVSKMPWPIKDRAMCERYTYYEQADKGLIGIRWKEAWEECPKPLNKKIVRMPIIRGKWEFTLTGNNSCKAVYLAQFDPGKGMPAGMVNSMAGKFLVEEFNSIKILAEKNERSEIHKQ